MIKDGPQILNRKVGLGSCIHTYWLTEIGSYRWAWSWFEAGIVRATHPPLPFPSLPQPRFFSFTARYPLDLTRPAALRTLDSDPNPAIEVSLGSKKRWLVQRNLRAVNTTQWNEVLWFNDTETQRSSSVPIADVTDSSEATEEGFLYTPVHDDEDVLHGRGTGNGFIELLEAGDRIALYARAKVCHFNMFPPRADVPCML
jgi:hypothetical protein